MAENAKKRRLILWQHVIFLIEPIKEIKIPCGDKDLATAQKRRIDLVSSSMPLRGDEGSLW